MALERLSLENYRCFADRQEIELRPLTVVLGKNNSGKSALVRAPLVLSTGLWPKAEAGIPLDLYQLGDDPPDFADLIYSGAAHRPIGLGMTFSGHEFDYGLTLGDITIDARIQNVTDWDKQVVSSLSYASPMERLRMEWVFEDEDPGPYRRKYEITERNGGTGEGRFGFRGLLPVRAEEHDDYFINQLEVDEYVGIDVRYTGPFRTRASRATRLYERPPRHDEFGRGIDGIIVHDKINKDGVLTAKVNEYLKHYLPDWELDVAQRYGGHSVGLRSRDNPETWVSAVDSGTGVTQVLPLLIRRALDAIEPPERDVLEIIEEPELHLHPYAQAGLADLYRLAAKESPRVRFLIETHSETFLLRLQRRVAEGKLSPDDIVLYYVDHDGSAANVRRINIDEYGNVDFWPEGIFEESFQEAKALSKAQAVRLAGQ
ncbi:DUF3696 domain-containing protein [Actinocorallia lasiicapitis]